MKDHFGRTIKEGDLVVSKPTGRHSSMSHGLAVGGGSVRFSRGSIGGSADQVLIDTTNDPEMRKIQEDLVVKFAEIDKKKAEEAAKKKKGKLKKSEIVRFGVYSWDGYSPEILLGPCVIQGDEFENCWLSTGLTAQALTVADIKFSKFVASKDFWGRRKGDFLFQYTRDVKSPSKDKEHFIYKRETLEAELGPLGVKLL